MKNSEIIKKSKSLLKSNYGKVMFPYFITCFIIGLFINIQDLFIIILNIAEVESEIAFQITGIVSPIIYLIVFSCLSIGLASFSLSIANKQEIRSNKLFEGFKIIPKATAIGLIQWIITLIGFVLLIIPGIILSLMCSQVYYIAKKNPDLDVIEVFKRSFQLMKGNKWQLFLLYLRYTLFFLLSFFTLFIWALWLIPQFHVANALFHEKISNEYTD